jgi:pentatricopeptide repeat protein
MNQEVPPPHDVCDTSSVPEPSPNVFAGREAELHVLTSALAALDDTGGRTVFIGGDAGIGKSRLIEELTDRARTAGSIVVAGLCTPSEGAGLAYAPIVGAIREASQRLDPSVAQAVLAPARQVLGLDDAPAVAFTDGMAKTRLFETLLRCFAAVAERSRLVLVFEDLHWADSASVEFIDFLARNIAGSPMLLVASYRTDEVGADSALRGMLVELGRHRAVSELALTGLDRDATAQLMAAVLGEQPEWALLEAVHARADGNPFWAEELTAARGSASLPSSLRNIVMLRIEQLSREARHVANVVSVAGGAVDVRILLDATDLDDGQFAAALAAAVERHVLMVDESDHVRFRHQLQSDAVHEALLAIERARLHRQMAVVLQAHASSGLAGPGHAAAELSRHWWEAGDWAEALPPSIEAADEMAAILAMPEACTYYERGITCCERLPDETGRATIDFVDLLLKASEAAFHGGANERSLPWIEDALGRIDPEADPHRAAAAYTALARCVLGEGNPQRALEALRRAEEILPSSPSPALARVIAEEARCLMLSARAVEAEQRCHDALVVARACDSREFEGHALNTLGCCRGEQGDHDAAVALLREALEIAEELRDPDSLARAYGNLTYVLLGAGELAEAAALVLERIDQGEQIVGLRLRTAASNAADALIRLGRWDDADRLLEQMDSMSGCGPSTPPATRALLDIRRGRFEQAASNVAAAERELGDSYLWQELGFVRLVRAELALDQGRPEHAYNEMEQALAEASGTDDTTLRPEMCLLALRALADEHDLARARNRSIDLDKYRRLADALLEQAVLHTPHVGSGEPPARAGGFVAWCRAEVTRLHDPTPTVWSDAADLWDSAREPYYAAYCRLREAETVLAARGDRARAAAAAQAAWETCLELGAAPLQMRVELFATRARIALVAPAPIESDTSRTTVMSDLGLTAREYDVLEQLALGHTDKQIAEALFISRKTVSVHVSNILRKLDVPDRFGAASIAHDVGLGVTPPPVA